MKQVDDNSKLRLPFTIFTPASKLQTEQSQCMTAHNIPPLAFPSGPTENAHEQADSPSINGDSQPPSPEKTDPSKGPAHLILSPIPTRPDRATAPSFRLLSPPTPPPMLQEPPNGMTNGVDGRGNLQLLDVGQATRKLRRRGRSLRKTALLKPPLTSPIPLPLPPGHQSPSYYSDSSSTSPPLKGQSAGGSPAPTADWGGGYGYLPPPVGGTTSDTVFYGWVVLFSAWSVFVVGMGSVFGVWDWAWDVQPNANVTGQCSSWAREITAISTWETPAPTPIDPDDELPIAGYYPALIVLTAVMAWVWVLIAWVGLKYFKHAKIQAPRPPDDG